MLSNQTLHDYESQIAMNRNLTQATHRDVVQGALPLEVGEAPLHSLSALHISGAEPVLAKMGYYGGTQK